MKTFISRNILYKKGDNLYIGFGKKKFEQEQRIQKLGWDGIYWIVINEVMEGISVEFEECKWDGISIGEIGFYCVESNDLAKQKSHLDNYFVKCNDEFLAHPVDINKNDSVSHSKYEDKYICFKIKTLDISELSGEDNFVNK